MFVKVTLVLLVYTHELFHCYVLHLGIEQKQVFSDKECQIIEKQINGIVANAEKGMYKKQTVDHAPLRMKYFFGEVTFTTYITHFLKL